MYLVAIAWIYVVLMMAVAEAMSTQGTVLGGLITFVLYGVLPLSIVLYVLGSPMRRRARLQAEDAADAAAVTTEAEQASATPPDGSRQAPGGSAPGLLTAERKEI